MSRIRNIPGGSEAAATDWLNNEWTNNRTRARMRRETRPK